MDILLLNVLAGDYVTGVYSLAYSVVRVAIKLIQSYWRALYPTLSRLQRHADAQYRKLATLSLRYGLMAALPGAAIGVGVGGELLFLLYGSASDESVVVFQILIWATPLFLVETYAITQLMVAHLPQRSLAITGLHIAVVVIFLPLLTLEYDAAGAALSVLLASSTGVLSGLYALRHRGIPCQIGGTWALLLAALVAGGLAVMFPAPWPVRLLVAGLSYLLLVWATGVFSPDDRQYLRQALLPKGS
jgi:O-antigen/teichoic acid export membrane protein